MPHTRSQTFDDLPHVLKTLTLVLKTLIHKGPSVVLVDSGCFAKLGLVAVFTLLSLYQPPSHLAI